MVFGYYHITLRTIQKGAIPEIDNIPGAEVSEKIKLGHMLWIPFFPLGKVWVMERDGQMYSLAHPIVTSLNKKFGSSGTPWYAFLGWILIPLVLGIYGIGNYIDDKQSAKRHKANFEKTLAFNLDKVNNPGKSDIFIFKNPSYQKLGLKVNYSTTDSIYFLCPPDNKNKKWEQKNWAAGYYSSDNPTIEVAFAKADLKKTFKNELKESMHRKGVEGDKIPMSGLLQLEKVLTIVETDVIPVVSEAETKKVKDDFNHFVQHAGNLDSLVALIDQKSHIYYSGILAQAAKKDSEIVKDLKAKRGKNSCLYELLLYTKYVYLDTDKKAIGKTISTETKKDYLFFLKLLEKGFLTLDDSRLQNMTISSVSIPHQGQAKLSLKGPSNLLKKSTNIGFNIIMHKEGDRWKINLPSTYSYSENQISGPWSYSAETGKQWREMVRNSVSSVGNDVFIANDWFY